MSEVMPLVGSEVRGLQVNQVSGAMLASGAKTQHFQLRLGDTTYGCQAVCCTVQVITGSANGDENELVSLSRTSVLSSAGRVVQ